MPSTQTNPWLHLGNSNPRECCRYHQVPLRVWGSFGNEQTFKNNRKLFSTNQKSLQCCHQPPGSLSEHLSILSFDCLWRDIYFIFLCPFLLTDIFVQLAIMTLCDFYGRWKRRS
ncbi:hypothetical protein GOODEAATRI_030829 [Goodea atripinnis]|uniref:Uncharacterized protein n=1 Tax=Goodea atripinnis TaxID=208336 RepID=A0ABV0PIT0_9TELE